MQTLYRVLAYLVAAGVVIQAATITFATFGLSTWIMAGGTLDKAAIESETTQFSGSSGFMAHGMGGMMIIPALALLLLIVSFFAKVPGGVAWAAYVFVAVALQVVLALTAHGLPAVGLLHGANALLLFWLAWTAGRRVRRLRPELGAEQRDRVSSVAD